MGHPNVWCIQIYRGAYEGIGASRSMSDIQMYGASKAMGASKHTERNPNIQEASKHTMGVQPYRGHPKTYRGHPNIKGVSIHMGASEGNGTSKHMEHPNIQWASKWGIQTCRGCPNIWGCPNVWGHPNIQGAYEHRGAYGHPLGLTTPHTCL